jgi:hypothetical protein
VADAVWAAYHDTTGKLHWYVPEDLKKFEKAVATDIEGVRDSSIKGFTGRVKAK